MDNLTHSLVSVSVAEVTHLYSPISETPSHIRRWVYWIISVLAGNMSDLDFIWARRLGPSNLGYLLHHRGHTHTLVMALPQACLLLGLFYGWFRLRKRKMTKFEWLITACLAILGPILHISLDWLNSYGVHPFWPFDNRWYYGDSLFIVEPVVWILFIVPLTWSFQRRLYQNTWRLFLVATFALIWFTPYLPKSLAILWSVLAILYLIATRFCTRPYLPFISIGLFLVFLTFMLNFSRTIKRETLRLYEKTSPGLRVHDLAVSPFPANPFCWRVGTVEALDTKQGYQIRRGVIALLPEFLSIEDCMALVPFNETAVTPTVSNVFWYRNNTYLLESWREALKDCRAVAYLHYARLPGIELQNGQYNLFDLRFENRRAKGSFADLPLTREGITCDFTIPPWDPPRAELFSAIGLGYTVK